jgi:hypothetical protein
VVLLKKVGEVCSFAVTIETPPLFWGHDKTVPYENQSLGAYCAKNHKRERERERERERD